jgi:hypothetical protein
MTEPECDALTVEKAPTSDMACSDPALPVCCVLTKEYNDNDGFAANLILTLSNLIGISLPVAANIPAGQQPVAEVAGEPPVKPQESVSTLIQRQSRVSRTDRTKRNLATLRRLRSKTKVLAKGCDTPTCSDGTAPAEGKGIPASSNGCGPEGAADWVIKALDHPVLKPCCDTHDICYGTIGSDRPDCDGRFFHCMTYECKGLPWYYRYGCYEASAIYWAAVRAGGCSAWQDAQVKSGCP